MRTSMRRPLTLGVIALLGVSAAACSNVSLVASESGCLSLEAAPVASDSRVGCIEKTQVTFRNICAREIRVVAHELSGESAAFAIADAPSVALGGSSVAPNGTVTYAVAFSPSREGTFEAVLSVTWTSAGAPRTTTVPLHATASDVLWQVDEYRRPEPRPIDVLVVIDNGPSLEAHRESLRKNLDAFARFLSIQRAQINFALTTVAGTSVSNRAQFVALNDQAVLDSKSATFRADVATLVDGLEFRESQHDTLSTVLDALAPDALAGSNAGFWRDNAVLGVLAITDHADASPAPAGDYATALLATKSDSFMASLSVIAPFVASLQCAEGLDDGRLADAVRITNGMREDLCIAEWEKSLEPVGKGFEGIFPIALTRRPDLSKDPLDVRIDGVRVEPIDSRGATVWMFDPETNSVLFEPMYAPEWDQLLTMKYRVACGG